MTRFFTPHPVTGYTLAESIAYVALFSIIAFATATMCGLA